MLATSVRHLISTLYRSSGLVLCNLNKSESAPSLTRTVDALVGLIIFALLIDIKPSQIQYKPRAKSHNDHHISPAGRL